jgi:hypothetical protein
LIGKFEAMLEEFKDMTGRRENTRRDLANSGSKGKMQKRCCGSHSREVETYYDSLDL